MYKLKVMFVFLLMFLVINVILILNLLFFKDQVIAYGEKKEKRKYQDGDYKIYNDYLVQDPLEYAQLNLQTKIIIMKNNLIIMMNYLNNKNHFI